MEQNTNHDIPQGYNDNKIMLMVRDPWTMYTYWETRREEEEKVRRDIADKGLISSKSILRVYDITDAKNEKEWRRIFDFDLTGWINSWYIHTDDPGRNWIVELGIITTSGEFFPLVRSNAVQTPQHSMSNIVDGDWMCPEELYYEMFSDHEVGQSSLEMKELVERHLRKWLSSGGISSGASGIGKMRAGRK